MSVEVAAEVVWDQIAYSNGPVLYGITGVVHRRGGCRGRADSERGFGWHPATGSADELARSVVQCELCKRMK